MEQRLPGGNLGGAVRVGDTVRREAGPWTPGVAALLQHLESVGFTGEPAIGFEPMTYRLQVLERMFGGNRRR
jgi:hypothetical protein